MGQHLERMKIEFKELKEKYDKLVDFLGSPKFNTLHFEQKSLLKQQKEAMKKYGQILKKRIRLDEQIKEKLIF